MDRECHYDNRLRTRALTRAQKDGGNNIARHVRPVAHPQRANRTSVRWLFWTYGIEAAIVAHFSADIIYHVLGTVILRRKLKYV